MKIQLLKNDDSEIVTEKEKKKLQTNLNLLQGSKFLFPLDIKDFFDLVLYNKLKEEKLKDDLFNARIKMAYGENVSDRDIAAIKSSIAKQIELNKTLMSALERDIKERGYNYNVEFKMKDLMIALRTEQKYEGKRVKLLSEASNKKQSILNEIEEIEKEQEPKV